MGRISHKEDIRKIKSLGEGVEGIILGKALYTGQLNLKKYAVFCGGMKVLARRIIPCLDVKEGKVVKGVHFENIKDVGDPVELAQRYEEEGQMSWFFWI